MLRRTSRVANGLAGTRIKRFRANEKAAEAAFQEMLR
jgi:hypothetical protein